VVRKCNASACGTHAEAKLTNGMKEVYGREEKQKNRKTEKIRE